MRIAIFDNKVASTSPAGSCHLHILRELCREHEFTVFAVEFENPCPERIRFLRIPAPGRPLALLFITYHLLAPLYYLWYRLRHRLRFDLVQMVESNLSFGDICYSHFCHRAYLRYYWKELRSRGLRGRMRWLAHWLHALMEPWIYKRARYVVVPSQGLRRELEAEYPFTTGKISVIPNAVDIRHMECPVGFNRDMFRKDLGYTQDDVVLVFVALGNFEHKGLSLVLEAMRKLNRVGIKLLVVGGTFDTVIEWRRRAQKMALGTTVHFTGMQRDVRPYLWAADAFILPSLRETFPLAVLEAAAAGLPLLVTQLYGVEEYMLDGEAGFVMERSVDGVADGLRRFMDLSLEERRAMGRKARDAAIKFSVERFAREWSRLYSQLARETDHGH